MRSGAVCFGVLAFVDQAFALDRNVVLELDLGSEFEPVPPKAHPLSSEFLTTGDRREFTEHTLETFHHKCSSLHDPWQCDDDSGKGLKNSSRLDATCLFCKKYRRRSRYGGRWESYWIGTFCKADGSQVVNVEYDGLDGENCKGGDWEMDYIDTSHREKNPKCTVECFTDDGTGIGDCGGCKFFRSEDEQKNMEGFTSWYTVVDPFFKCDPSMGQCLKVNASTPGAAHYSECRSLCPTTTTTTTTTTSAPHYACVDNQCVIGTKGVLSKSTCEQVCNPTIGTDEDGLLAVV